jgi:hypothetical protein
MIDTAMELRITDPDIGGISAAGCVRLAMKYGEPGRSSSTLFLKARIWCSGTGGSKFLCPRIPV